MQRYFNLFVLFILLSSMAACGPKNNINTAPDISSLPYSTVQVADAQLAYRVYGKGEPLLMIMGFAGTMDLWDLDLIRELAKNHKVILFDNRGMGGSSLGTESISITRMADDSAGLLDALGYEKSHVLGWSMGGLIAQELALNHPEKVEKLILMGAACESEPVAKITKELMKMDTKELLSHFFPKAWLDKHPDAISKLPSSKNPPNIEIIKAQGEALINWSGTCDRLESLHKDTLIISGMQDDILPETLSFELAEKIQGAWLVRFKNAAHWLMYQAPVSLARTISTFLIVREDMLAQ
ncbi:Pimeloyl-ACP methyl ester carboxylesterase [Maridesulfovibrio ferrireducens]|uniref:Pimeloyl-ACP methyl ester carboxylesterase n=1 Tax=Maridesulfovibrio ferrireducens TaxID=246191 RepID=A0A1G9CC58_9BACT|nr:alpha/beta hydrolase [Maridesulfovibrio ferrireducens]SDK49220.1 Pimeloyl-ACP methyl ester carboxylesterase [Maridesulfovibrio ferrireducens]